MSSLFVPKPLALLTHRRRERIVTLKTGERVRVSVDDSGTVTQVEHNDTLDAVVRPPSVVIQIRRAR